jgi:NAD(P)-dependent dehydrogenase (short-subunit alcohol dehydrogenase family)
LGFVLEAVDQALRVGCPTIWWPGWCGKKRTLGGTVRLTRVLVSSMKEHHWERIINIGSEAGMQLDPFVQHYNAANAAHKSGTIVSV